MKYLLILLLMIPFAYSIEYYVDSEFTVMDNGDVEIQGSTNIDLVSDIEREGDRIIGTSQILTSKKGKFWLLELDSARNVTSFISINLPDGAVVNFIKSELSINIETQDDKITIKFFGESEPVDIQVQYSIGKASGINYMVVMGVILGLLLLWYYYKRNPVKKPIAKEEAPIQQKTEEIAPEIKENALDTIKPTLNETQIKIIDALLEKNGEASQTTIMYMSQLPKSSLSRNVELLVQKEILQKFYNGTSNYIKIHPKYKNS